MNRFVTCGSACLFLTQGEILASRSMALSQTLTKKFAVKTVSQYRRRVRILAAIYILITLLALATIALLAYEIKYFMVLTQRSNVETLLLVFVLVLFFYLAVTNFPGMIGGIRLFSLLLPRVFGRDFREVEKRKQQRIRSKNLRQEMVCINVLVEAEGKPCQPISLKLKDEAGELLEVIISGSELQAMGYVKHIPNALFEFLATQIEELIKKLEGRGVNIAVVGWNSINEEQTQAFASVVKAFQNLEQALKTPLWPRVILTEKALELLQQQLTALTPSLREDMLLPDLEYQVEYKFPIIPEPLGFLSLARQESRADPVITMGCALLIVIFTLGLLIFYLLLPPWVPGK